MTPLPRRTILLLLLLATAAAESPTLRSSRRRSLADTSSGNVYDQYAENSEGRGKLAVVFFGFVAAVGTLAGFLFLIDEEVFDCKCGPCRCNISSIRLCQTDVDNDIAEDQYVTPESAQKHMAVQQRKPRPQSPSSATCADNAPARIPWVNLTFAKPRISRDEYDDAINEEYITPETKEYLEERKARPWRWWMARKYLPFLFKTKEYDEDDKYRAQKPDITDLPLPTDMDEDETIVSVLSAQMEEVRLRLFWKPTKDYDENDKYAVTVQDSDLEEPEGDASSPYGRAKMTPALPWEEEEERERKNSSFESADSTVVPYK